MPFESVSIIMPAYNAARYIHHSVESVLSQSFGNWRLYIVDDASTDDTANIVADIHDNRIEYILLNDNVGVAGARNVGISAAKGKYIAFLDSDDIWASNKLSLQLKVLEGGYDVVCSHYQTFFHDISNVNSIRRFSEVFDYNSMLCGNKIGNLTGIYNQEKLGKVYQLNIGHEDYVMWLELVKRAGKVFCVQDVLAYYRLSKSSLSANKVKASSWQWRVYREYQNMSFLNSAYYWVRYVVNAVFR